jgi:hypothetical protein
MEQFNPCLRNFVAMGKSYEKALASEFSPFIFFLILFCSFIYLFSTVLVFSPQVWADGQFTILRLSLSLALSLSLSLCVFICLYL